MYPGYSPADHEYGKAAQEFGAAIALAKARGIEVKLDPEGPQYEFAQAKGVKKRTLEQLKTAKAEKGEGTGSGTDSGSDEVAPATATNGGTTNGDHKEMGTGEESKEADNAFFVIDTNPTRVNLSGVSHEPTKRAPEDQSPKELVERKKSKKAKTKHDGELPKNADEKPVEFEDISEEVDARLKEKEEKRKRKEEKKRKRESAGSGAVVAEVASPPAEVEKPKKKKHKKPKVEEDVIEQTSKRRHGSSGEEGADEGKKKKKKKRKTTKDSDL